jgi:uncharacterized protein (TIGR03067 family)
MSGRIAFLWCAVALAAPALVGAAADDETDKDLKQLEGVWVLESQEVGGKKVTAEQLKAETITFLQDRWARKRGDEFIAVGTLKLDASKSPKTIDIKATDGVGKGTVALGIYELDGDTLKECFDPDGKERPTEFKTAAGSGTVLRVLKRAKK